LSDLLSKVRQEVGNTGPDLTKPQSGGGGDYAPPDAGPTRLRLVGYIETGIHTNRRGGIAKTKPRVELVFELSGPKHPAKELDDGRKIPHRVRVKEVLSTHEKANLIKLFNLMNVDGDARNFLDLMLEKAWRGTISHYEFNTQSGQKRTIAQLRGKGQGYQIFPVSFEDPESGELRTVSVPPALSEPQVFLWEYATTEQWDSLDKFVKETIKKAENFVGSPIYQALIEAGREADTVPEAADSEQQAEPDSDDTEDTSEAAAPAPAPEKPAKAPASAAKAPKATGKGKAAQADADPLQGL
jgi:hypothetical protein